VLQKSRSVYTAAFLYQALYCTLKGGLGGDTYIFDYVRADKKTWDHKENDVIVDFTNDLDELQIHADFGLSVAKLIK
jgi:hypothetical protein